MFNVRFGSVDKREDTYSGVGASEGLGSVIVGSDGTDDG